MKLTPKGNGYVLDSGREIYALGGILGMDDQGNLFEGLDGTVEDAGYRQLWAEEDFRQFSDRPPLTDAERAEIGTEMVRRWIAWGWPTAKACDLTAYVAKVGAPGYCAMCDDGRPHTH